MSKEEKRIIEVSKNFVIAILNQNINHESVSELYEITSGNKEVLLDHLKAINNIINDAIKILEGENNE